MTKSITYYLSLNSPWSFLGGPMLAELAQKHGATVDVRPIHFGMVFERSGGIPLPKRSQQRQDYRMTELKRWRAERNLPLNLQPASFPTNDQAAAAMVYAAQDVGADGLALANAIGWAQWCDEKDFADEETLVAIANSAGMDGIALLAASKDEKFSAPYTGLVDEALEQGVFGAPSYLYNGELFWGQDRLEFLDRALES